MPFYQEAALEKSKPINYSIFFYLCSFLFHYIKGKDAFVFRQREELPFSAKFNFSKALEMKIAKLLSIALLFLVLDVICLDIFYHGYLAL